MRQRLGIAAALLGEPTVLIFDEPVNRLDPDGVRWVRQLMRTLADEGRAVLVSNHLVAEMELTELTSALEAADATVTPEPDGAFAVSGLDAAPSLARRGRHPLHEIVARRVSLEEAYMRLTADSADHHAGPSRRRGRR